MYRRRLYRASTFSGTLTVLICLPTKVNSPMFKRLVVIVICHLVNCTPLKASVVCNCGHVASFHYSAGLEQHNGPSSGDWSPGLGGVFFRPKLQQRGARFGRHALGVNRPASSTDRHSHIEASDICAPRQIFELHCLLPAPPASPRPPTTWPTPQWKIARSTTLTTSLSSRPPLPSPRKSSQK